MSSQQLPPTTTIVAVTWRQASMAAPTPTTAKLMAIITMLQAQIVALQNAAPAAAAAPPAGAANVVVANTPQTLGANDLIDYSTKRGSTIFKQGCKPLDDKALTDSFAMTPDQTVIFVKAFRHCATTMGWNQGAMQITSFANSASRQVDIIKSYGQIIKATLKSACERFCKPGGVHSQTRVKQNNTMMIICLSSCPRLTHKQDCSLTGTSTRLMGLSMLLSCTKSS
jgi:hypothetical protein